MFDIVEAIRSLHPYSIQYLLPAAIDLYLLTDHNSNNAEQERGMLVLETPVGSAKSRSLKLDKFGTKMFGFYFKTTFERVHEVTDIMPGGGAEMAGLSKWDKILEM